MYPKIGPVQHWGEECGNPACISQQQQNKLYLILTGSLGAWLNSRWHYWWHTWHTLHTLHPWSHHPHAAHLCLHTSSLHALHTLHTTHTSVLARWCFCQEVTKMIMCVISLNLDLNYFLFN